MPGRVFAIGGGITLSKADTEYELSIFMLIFVQLTFDPWIGMAYCRHLLPEAIKTFFRRVLEPPSQTSLCTLIDQITTHSRIKS